MAKTKKVATPEEVLQESEYLATVAPFQIPQNWCWTSLGKVCHLNKGESIENTLLPYWDAKSLRGTKEAEIVDSGCIVEAGEKVILVDGENSGEVFSIPSKGYMGSTFKVLDVCKSVNQIYIQYFIDSYREKLRNNKVGSAIPHLNKELFFDLSIPLPPLTEQNRIVEKIDSMFQKLDEAKELIQQSIDNFADRRAAILHKAFSGELTEGWRTEEFMWREVDLDSVSHSFQYGTSKKSEKDGKCVVIRMGNLQNGKIDWTDLAYSNDDEDIEKYRLEKDDVLFNRTNSADLVGKTSIFDGSRAAIFAGYLIRINYNKNLITGPFLNYLLNSPSAREYCSKVKSDAVNQSNINAKKLAAFRFSLPSIPEQQEIVRILDNYFEKEDKTKELLDMLDRIDEMKKAILSRAFRGELGTNDPEYEPAINQITQLDRLIGNAGEEKQQAYSAKRRVTKIAPQIGVVLKSDMERTIVKQFAKRNSNTLSAQILLDSAPNKIALVKAIDNMVDRRILKRLPNNMFKMEKKK